MHGKAYVHEKEYIDSFERFLLFFVPGFRFQTAEKETYQGRKNQQNSYKHKTSIGERGSSLQTGIRNLPFFYFINQEYSKYRIYNPYEYESEK